MISDQQAVDSGQWSVISRQWTVVSRRWAIFSDAAKIELELRRICVRRNSLELPLFSMPLQSPWEVGQLLSPLLQPGNRNPGGRRACAARTRPSQNAHDR